MAGRSTATRLRRQDAIRSQSIAAPPEIHPRSGVIPDEREDPGPGRCPQPAFERPLNLQLLVVLEPDPVDQLELSLQEIDVVLFIREDHREKIAADIVRDRLAMSDRRTKVGDALLLDRKSTRLNSSH